MSTKSFLLPCLLIIFVSSSQASRQLWDSAFHEFFSKSGFHGESINGINKVHGIQGFHHGTHGIPKFPRTDFSVQTCSMQGPCKGKKLKCPETCYKSTNVNKEGYKSTSRSGGCSFDCTTTCAATCSL
ncbi:unnamed protein product [Eruca vesicaria subsp. sativa]|uniref:Uncharacterized protein n=1 Tax=Eruca vesicaria subsp. sativa TaxID=29727 RepID=A0ABC8M9U9_ERUVS|nr:unnamed protein product [Eruca vesicaria subsp. sativa]